ncbi:hypothetical protein [Cryobacterium luteum]|uniref:Uncharacterized protein n=1 Tax=Cryobacterium luteum TaxID=1424661 RepID=A0A1H8M4V6_9MICO|nr:hypothetical protein [Cryobacterium luteum]TFB90089.1 hypothetical protein E3O10_07185 [Cryobacterium luteum]SEO12412.1 hypothetical protein SAMN05216281_13712 [Cryobacterium luteum]
MSHLNAGADDAQNESPAESYARVLTHAPVLSGPNGDFVEAGPQAARSIANAIEPFMRGTFLDRAGVINRLVHGTPPVLGGSNSEFARALATEEVHRIVNVCDLLMIVKNAKPA